MAIRASISVLMLLAAIGCGADSSEEVKLSLNIELDSAFSKNQKQAIKNDFDWFESFDIPEFHSELRQDSLRWYETTKRGRELKGVQNVPGLSRWFEDVFGGHQAQNVFDFIDDRTAYYVASRTMGQSHIYADASIDPENKLSTLATNVGARLFLTSIYLDKTLTFNFGDRFIKVGDSRVGIVELTDEFFNVGVYGDSAKISRLGVLVHEARHSDCDAEIKRSDVVAMVDVTDSHVQIPSSCIHSHVACPVGHDYAGVEVCDDQPWGAYGVTAVFAARLAQCENCSEMARQAALMFSIDQASRVLQPDRAFSGEMGFPEMNHAPKILWDVK